MLPRALAWCALPVLAAAACAAPKDEVRRDSVDTLPPSVVRDSARATPPPTDASTQRDSPSMKTPNAAGRPEPKPNAAPDKSAPAPADSSVRRPAPPKRVIHDPVLPPVDSGRPPRR